MAMRQTPVLSARYAFFAYLLLPVAGYAQSTFGDIRGTVTVMSAEKIDYAHVLADMEARRTALDAAIASMRAFLSGQLGDAAMVGPSASSVPTNGEVPAGAFLGKSIPDAAKLFLQIVKRKATSRDIAEALRRGGMESTSNNFQGIVHAVLDRARKSGGDLVKLDRSHWGLADWYPAGVRAVALQEKTPRRKKPGRSKGRKKANEKTSSGAPGIQSEIERIIDNTAQSLSSFDVAKMLNARVQTVGLTLRFGMDARHVFYETVVRWGQSDDFGAFTFNQGVFTGSSFGDLLLGAPNTDFIVASSPNTNESAVHWGFYGQDQWQVNDRLTVTFGLRWEVNPQFVENTGDIANFLPINGGEVVVPDNLAKTVASNPLLQANYNAFLVSFNACSLPTRVQSLPCSNVVTASQAGLPASLRNTYWGDYDPRISFAYRPFRDNKTVVRAGFGIFTQTMLGPLAYTSIGIPLGAPYTYSNNNNGQPLFTFPQTSPANAALQYGGTGFYDAMNPNFKDPQTAQWNVTVERQLTSDTALRVSYVGMNSYRMNVTEDYNAIPPSAQPYVPSPYVDPRAPYQNWIQLYVSQNAGFANYQGLTVEATRRMSHGLFFQANYTWAHDISDAQGDAPGGFVPEVLLFTPTADQFDLRAARGNVAGMPRQRFLLTGSYQLPFGPGRAWKSGNKFVNGALGGWNLNTVTLLQTGPWLTPTISPTEDQSNTDIVGRAGITLRPDRLGTNPNTASGDVLWNINAFAPTPANAGRIGNAAVGTLEGPGTIAVSAGLSKVFAIRERMRIRFESTFTNALNHTNFVPPASDVSSPSTFGVLQSAQTAGQGGNRTGQLALRLDF
jgi:hypothetical protein